MENKERLQKLLTVLFGHSLRTYASAAVLQSGHKIKSAIIGTITVYGLFKKQQNSYILDLREALRK